MRGFCISAIFQESLKIGAIIIVLAQLGDGSAVESDITLNREWRLLATTVVSVKSTSFPGTRPIYLERRVFYLNICRCLNRWVLKIPDRSYRRGDWFIDGLCRPQHRRLNRPVCKYVGVAADGRDLVTGHDEL